MKAADAQTPSHAVALEPIGSVVWHGVETTLRAGRALGLLVPVPCTVALSGPMGAGKTHFTKGLASGMCGVTVAAVRSPTFTLLHTYRGNGRAVHHIDLCRITSAEEVPSDVADAMGDVGAVCAVEWADLFPAIWPERVVAIELSHGPGEEDRTAVVSARGVDRKALRAWLEASVREGAGSTQ